jgi:hypothetical protein
MFRTFSDAQELESFNFRLLLENFCACDFSRSCDDALEEIFLVEESCRYNGVAQVCRFYVQLCIDPVEFDTSSFCTLQCPLLRCKCFDLRSKL